MWDVSQAEDVGSSVLPAGSYNVVVEKTELKNTKSGTGEYISVMFNVVDESVDICEGVINNNSVSLVTIEFE